MGASTVGLARVGVRGAASWCLGAKKTGDCLPSLLEEDRESVEVHSGLVPTPAVLPRGAARGLATLGFLWILSFLMVLPLSMSSTYLRKSRSNW